MSVMITPNHIENIVGLLGIDVDTTPEINFDYSIFKKDHHLKTYFESNLGMELKAVYCDEQHHPEKGRLDWGASTILLFLKNGKIVELKNSEWASIDVVKSALSNKE